MISTRSPLRVGIPTSAVLLVAASAWAWVGVLVIAGDMGVMPRTMGLGVASFLAVWALMMTAMMLPSVMPVAALYTRTMVDDRGRRLAFYTGGYLLVWAAAGIAAYGLASLAGRVVEGRGATAFAVALFAACGVYQLTPLKDRCLARCRSPLGFLMRYSSYQGPTRDVRVGLHHGGFCLACCWSLMMLLVAFGLMNVVAMVGVASVVLVEKVWVRGPAFARAVGVAALVFAVLVVWWPALAPGLEGGSRMAGM